MCGTELNKIEVTRFRICFAGLLNTVQMHEYCQIIVFNIRILEEFLATLFENEKFHSIEFKHKLLEMRI